MKLAEPSHHRAHNVSGCHPPSGGWGPSSPYTAVSCECGEEFQESHEYEGRREIAEAEHRARSRYLQHLEEMRIRGLLLPL